MFFSKKNQIEYNENKFEFAFLLYFFVETLNHSEHRRVDDGAGVEKFVHLNTFTIMCHQ